MKTNLHPDTLELFPEYDPYPWVYPEPEPEPVDLDVVDYMERVAS